MDLHRKTAYLASKPVQTTVSHPKQGMLAPAPYVHIADQKESGKTVSDAPYLEIKSKDGYAENAVDASQTHKM